jgi:hypothetical protein
VEKPNDTPFFRTPAGRNFHKPFRSRNTPLPRSDLPRCPAADNFRAPQKRAWKEIGIMATNEVDRSSEIYVKVVGTLMVILLAYGALSLIGVVR